MSLAQLVPVLMQASLGLVVVGLGLQTEPGDLTYLLRRPALLLRSVLSMNVVTPLLAAAIAAGFHLAPELEVALVLLAVSPVPPVLPTKQAKAGGNSSYAIGLLACSAVLAIVAVPISIAAIGRAFGVPVRVPASLIARVVGTSVLAPLLAGVLVRRIAPGAATRISRPVSAIGSAMLGVLALVVVAASWRKLAGAMGQFTVVAVVAFVLVSLLVGHALGGPEADDRTVLALSTASRHPGVALAVAGAIAAGLPAVAATGVTATVMLAFLVGLLVTGPYTKWRRVASAAPTRGA
jgi:BASS family bile acid:Na+ symporter